MRSGRVMLFLAAVLIWASMSSFALQITQIEFDLHLAPGSADTYTFQVINNESDSQDVIVYIGDWTRTKNGENDFLPLDSARWLFARDFKEGDALDVKYCQGRLCMWESLGTGGDCRDRQAYLHRGATSR